MQQLIVILMVSTTVLMVLGENYMHKGTEIDVSLLTDSKQLQFGTMQCIAEAEKSGED